MYIELWTQIVPNKFANNTLSNPMTKIKLNYTSKVRKCKSWTCCKAVPNILYKCISKQSPHNKNIQCVGPHPTQAEADTQIALDIINLIGLMATLTEDFHSPQTFYTMLLHNPHIFLQYPASIFTHATLLRSINTAKISDIYDSMSIQISIWGNCKYTVRQNKLYIFATNIVMTH